MIGLRATRTVFVAAALLCAPAHAAEESAVREMMVVSGMIEQFRDIGDGFRVGVLQSSAQQDLPPELAEGLADIGARAMEGERFIADLADALAATLSQEEAEVLTAFYGSPLGERLREVEVAASSPSNQLAIEANSAELLAELEGNPQRLALARRLDEVFHASELSATIAVNVGRAMALGMARSQPQGHSADALAALDGYFTSLHGSFVEQMRDYVLASFAFTYRGITTEDLEAYVRFLETDEALAVYAAVAEALYEILGERGEEIGEEFGALIRQKRT